MARWTCAESTTTDSRTYALLPCYNARVGCSVNQFPDHARFTRQRMSRGGRCEASWNCCERVVLRSFPEWWTGWALSFAVRLVEDSEGQNTEPHRSGEECSITLTCEHLSLRLVIATRQAIVVCTMWRAIRAETIQWS